MDRQSSIEKQIKFPFDKVNQIFLEKIENKILKSDTLCLLCFRYWKDFSFRQDPRLFRDLIFSQIK